MPVTRFALLATASVTKILGTALAQKAAGPTASFVVRQAEEVPK